jgi:hypothetical protein
LGTEINIRNLPSYRTNLTWLLHLENLINEAQACRSKYPNENIDRLINEWRKERGQIRITLKTAFNHSFGSVFRTYHNPSYFANKIRKVNRVHFDVYFVYFVYLLTV